MKKQKQRWLASILSIVMLIGLVPQSAFATAEQDLQHVIKESLNEDKTSATVEMEIIETPGNTLMEVVLPDGSSVFSDETKGVAGFKKDGKNIVRFTVTENGTVSFELKYSAQSEVEANPAPATEKVEAVVEDTDEMVTEAAIEDSGASASNAELNDNGKLTSEEPILEHKSMTVTHKVKSFSSLRSALPELKTLTIRYYIQGDTAMIAEPYIATQPVGTSYSVSSPDIEKFELADEGQAVLSGTLNESTQINVYYTYAPKTANYTIKYMLQNPITKLYEENGSATVAGTSPIGDTITVEDKVFTGYERQASELFLEITGDNTTKELYYDSIDLPYIVFQTGGSYVEPISAPAGADVSTESGSVPPPTRQGYTFNGWDTAIPTTMPTNDVVIKATWTPATSNYTVIHWLQNADDDNYVMSGDVETQTGTTEVLATDFDTKTYDNFNYSHKDEDVEITADGKAVLNVYYNRRILTFTFLNKDGSEWQSFSGRYNSLVPSNFPSPADCKEYYDTQYTDAITAGEKFVTMCSKIDMGSLYAPTRFIFIGTQVAETNLELIPAYSDTSKSFEGHTYVECLPGEEGDLQNSGLWYKHLDTKLAMVSGNSVNLYMKIPTGFVYQRNVIPVWYRMGPTLEAALSSWSRYISTAPKDNQVYANINQSYSIWGFRRFRGTITYSSKATDIQKLEDIYYEQDVDLTIVPTNGGIDEHFVGWYTSPQLFETQPLEKYQMTPNNLTFYAKWVRNNHTITFDSNGGSTVDPITVMGGTTADAPTDPTKAGFALTGWYKEDGTRWSFDMTVEEDVTLYAHWKRANTVEYKIEHFNLDTGTMLKTETLSAYIGDAMVARALTAQDAEYPDDTYLVPDFASKSLLISGDGSKDVIRFEYKDPTIKDYTVHYYEQGTTAPLAASKTIKGTYNTIVTEFAETIPDYTVDDEVKLTTLIYNAANTIIFYYVKGTTPPPIRYSVTYNPNDAFATGTVVDPTSPYIAGDTVTVLANAFTNAGKEFTGWNTQADGGGTSHAANATFAMPVGNVVLYAQWQSTGGGEDPTYTVTYHANGGTGSPVDPSSPYIAGDTVTVLENTFTNVDKEFIGWSTQKTTRSTVIYQPGETFTMPAENVVLYAQWQSTGGGEDPTYTVTYKANGGTGSRVDPSSPYIAGATVTVLENTFDNGSKEFTGWNTQADGGGTNYAAKATFTMPSANVVFYAQWKSPGGGSSSDPAYVTLTATKTLDGKAPTGSAFTFVLKDDKGNALQTKQNADGNITFDRLSFSQTGTYTYTITEQIGTDKGMNYDGVVYTVTIVVTKSGDYHAAVSYQKGDTAYSGIPVFVNSTKSGSGSSGGGKTPTSPKSPPTAGKEQNNVPKTSDSSNTSLWILLMGLSLTGLLGTIMIGRKKGCFNKK